MEALQYLISKSEEMISAPLGDFQAAVPPFPDTKYMEMTFVQREAMKRVAHQYLNLRFEEKTYAQREAMKTVALQYRGTKFEKIRRLNMEICRRSG
jgi:hypothetical protein